MGRIPHRERIYQRLLGQIQRGEIDASDRLVDTVLAAELGVSRMPVRDALLRLTHEGYLVGTTRGFMLPDLGRETILEFFEIRRLLEPRAAALAARTLDDAAIARMRGAVEQARSTLSSGDIELFYRASEAFRSCWLAAVTNGELRGIIERYLLHVQAVRMATMRDRVAHMIIVEGQEALLDCFVRRDAIAASDRMLRFVLDGEACYLKAVKPA